jgi:hypothetical protein
MEPLVTLPHFCYLFIANFYFSLYFLGEFHIRLTQAKVFPICSYIINLSFKKFNKCTRKWKRKIRNSLKLDNKPPKSGTKQRRSKNKKNDKNLKNLKNKHSPYSGRFGRAAPNARPRLHLQPLERHHLPEPGYHEVGAPGPRTGLAVAIFYYSKLV